jgi:hypothetical protein
LFFVSLPRGKAPLRRRLALFPTMDVDAEVARLASGDAVLVR